MQGKVQGTVHARVQGKRRAKVRVTVYPGAEHGFNNLDQPRTYPDPYHFQGKGGMGASAPNPVAREASREAVVTFFRESLAR